jgi:hypothetical protein
MSLTMLYFAAVVWAGAYLFAQTGAVVTIISVHILGESDNG